MAVVYELRNMRENKKLLFFVRFYTTGIDQQQQQQHYQLFTNTCYKE